MHVHASVLDDAKKLVLTDADFGRAYLTQGWARRFVQQLFSKFVVLFIGYSHQDLPLLYLARGISAAEDGPGRYALTSPTADTDWLNLGIEPVHYPMRAAPKSPHGALGECLAEWAVIANLGSLGTEARIKGIVTSERPLGIQDEDFLKQSLLDVSTLRYFTRHAKDPRWLEWVLEVPSFGAIFEPGAALSEHSTELAFWFAEHFAIFHYAAAIDTVRRKNQTLSPYLWSAVAQAFHRHAATGAPLRLWVPILTGTMPANAHADFLAYIISYSTVPDDQQSILQLFRKLIAPTLNLKRRYFSAEDGKPAAPDAEVVSFGKDYWTGHAYQTKIHPHLDVFAKGVASIVTATFEEARTLLLMYDKAGPKWDPISYFRGSVASRMQDHLHNGFSVLIDAGADVLGWANEHEPKFASSLIDQWIESNAPIMRRLAISGMTGHPSLTADEKLSWVIANRIVEDIGLKNETFALLAEVYRNSSEKLREGLVAQAEAAMNPVGEDHERYEFFNLLSWLHIQAPQCTLVTEKLAPIQERNPNWTVRVHPDFNSWISGGVRQIEPASPIPVPQIAEMNLEALLAESARLAGVKDTFGDSLQGGFLQEIALTASGNFPWSKGIAQEALARTDVPAEIWSALLRGWSGDHPPEEWRSLLATVERLEPMYSSVLHELSSLLKEAVGQTDSGLPVDLLDTAVTIASAVRAGCVAQEHPLPEQDEDWVTVAIKRTSARILEFYFEALRLLWPNRGQEQARIQSILQALETAIAGDSPAAEVTRILVSSRASLLADLSLNWYTEHVLPLLATPATLRSSEQNWDGELAWGTWTQATLPGLLAAYMQHLPAILGGSNDRSHMFCGRLAAFAVFGTIDPLDNGWLYEFLTRAAHRERMHWATNVTQQLREANEQAKESAWERWIERYLQRRVVLNPLPLDAQESGAMCEWALVLNAHYSEIVGLLLAGPAPNVKANMFYLRLQDENLLDRAPGLTARLLAVLLSQEDGREFWDLGQVHTMVSQLIDLNPAEPALRPLCERLGTLGSPMALDFQGRLR